VPLAANLICWYVFNCSQKWKCFKYTQCRRLLLSTQPKGWYVFHHPTEGRRLSQPRWLASVICEAVIHHSIIELLFVKIHEGTSETSHDWSQSLQFIRRSDTSTKLDILVKTKIRKWLTMSRDNEQWITLTCSQHSDKFIHRTRTAEMLNH